MIRSTPNKLISEIAESPTTATTTMTKPLIEEVAIPTATSVTATSSTNTNTHGGEQQPTASKNVAEAAKPLTGMSRSCSVTEILL